MNKDEREKVAQALWDEYKNDPSVENSNLLVEHYLYLIRPIVLRMSPMHKSTFGDYDDLISNGVLGLIDAVGKFDTMRNVKFETYAQIRIRGAIIDFLRKQDFIPTTMRKDIKLLNQATEELLLKNGKHPEYEDIAEHLNISVEKVKKVLLNEYQYSIMHFEDAIGGYPRFADREKQTGVTYGGLEEKEQVPEKALLKKESREVLIEVIKELPKKQQLVLDLFYKKELKLKEIAEIIGVSESRVSQIHKQAIAKITEKLKQEYSD